MPLFNKRYSLFCLLFSAIVFFFSAWLNQLYIHPDEFFQLVEFASYKMGITGIHQLSWEFNERMRSGLQPFLCYAIFKGLIKAGIADHYAHLLILRLLSACLTLFSSALFCLANLNYLIKEGYRKFYLLATFLFWMPYFYGVHFSSETWSGDFVLIAISLWLLFEQGRLIKYTRVLFYGIGLLLGLAFSFRFQTAFFVAGFAGWLIFIRREKLTALLFMIAGGITVLLIGACADRWLYGEWVFTPWCYFEGNIIRGLASHFGTAPFYSYFLWLLLYPSPVIGLVALIAMLTLFVKLPRNIYTWVLLPFLIGHSMVAHKEWRFLFPLLGFLPVVMVLAYQVIQAAPSLKGMASLPLLNRLIKPAMIALLLFSNFLMLFGFVFFASRYGSNSKLFAGHLHELAKKGELQICYTNAEANPYILPKGNNGEEVFPGYLREANIKNTRMESYCRCDTISSNLTPKTEEFIATTTYELEHDSCLAARSDNYEIIMSSLPTGLREPLDNSKREELDKGTFLILRLKNK